MNSQLNRNVSLPKRHTVRFLDVVEIKEENFFYSGSFMAATSSFFLQASSYTCMLILLV